MTLFLTQKTILKTLERWENSPPSLEKTIITLDFIIIALKDFLKTQKENYIPIPAYKQKEIHTLSELTIKINIALQKFKMLPETLFQNYETDSLFKKQFTLSILERTLVELESLQKSIDQKL